jgi:uncharacterized protein (DUF1697 family)
MRFAAFLRGVNVGGSKRVKMAALRAAFEDMGFTGVRPVQASGNVVFETGSTEDALSLAPRIERELLQTLGYRVGVAVRQLAGLQDLMATDPFRGVALTPATRLYVTFRLRPGTDGTGIDQKEIEQTPDHIQLVGVTPGEILTAVTLAPGRGTTELMAWLEQEVGSDITTRNWNTVTKIAGA